MHPQMASYLNLTAENILDITTSFGTPVHIYQQAIIEARIAELKGLDVIRYAQKANSNLELLRIMRGNGVLVDAVTAGEVLRALRAGYQGGKATNLANSPAEIVYTADMFDRDGREIIAEHQLAVNVGSAAMIPQLAEFSPLSELTLRINPGFGHGHSKKVNTGGETSKHGIWHEDIPEVIALCAKHGFKIHGLHLHIGSGSDLTHLGQVAKSVVALAPMIGPELKSISCGGGLPVPYREGESRLPIDKFTAVWREAKAEITRLLGREVSVEVEPGRYLVAEAGILVGEICAVKQSGSITYYLIDMGFDTLIRPAMYGAYHRISIIHRTEPEKPRPLLPRVAVAGPLCESCDVFTQGDGGELQPRALPSAQEGDLVVIHDTGAYGATMSSNYNSRRLAPEVLIFNSGQTKLVRRRQPLLDLLRLEEEHNYSPL